MMATVTENKNLVKPALLDLDPLYAEKGFTAPAAVTADAIEPDCPRDENLASGFSMEVNSTNYRPLFLASLKGDWDRTRQFFEWHPNSSTAQISSLSMTTLHAAVSTGQAEFVEKLVKLMPSEALAMQDSNGCTALHYAVINGNISIAKALVTKNPNLTRITNKEGQTPLLYAAVKAHKHKELVWYLAKLTVEEPPTRLITGQWAGDLIAALTFSRFHDISLYLLQQYPSLAIGKDSGILQMLAMDPSNFPSGSRLNFLERWIYRIVPAEFMSTSQHPVKGNVDNPPQECGHNADMLSSMKPSTCITRVFQRFTMLFWVAIEKMVPRIKRIQDEKLRHKNALQLVNFVCKQVLNMSKKEQIEYFSENNIMIVAIKCGVVEILTMCLQHFPELWFEFEDKKDLMEVVVEHRQEKFFNLMCERNAFNMDLVNSETLIAAAKLPLSSQLSSIPSPALQLQREMKWFKAMENYFPPAIKEWKIGEKTAWHKFQDEHKVMLLDGQKWMKETSNSCMLVATLIATVVFAAAFTVPGGNINDIGIPIFLDQKSFKVFVVCDALALFSSINSILMFLSILTSRLGVEDFLEALPKRLIIGLASLFIAIASMMAAFGATLSLVLSDTWVWVTIPIILLASIPAALFMMLQLPLFIQMVNSTYGPSIFCLQNIWECNYVQ